MIIGSVDGLESCGAVHVFVLYMQGFLVLVNVPFLVTLCVLCLPFLCDGLSDGFMCFMCSMFIASPGAYESKYYLD